MRRTKADAEKTRLKIIEAALTLFSRNGYSHTTLAKIAREAGFSRGPIYWHFQNKDDLYRAVLAYSQEPLKQLVADAGDRATDPLQAIDRFVRSWLDLLVEDAWFRQSFEILLNKTELTDAMADTLQTEHSLTRQVIDVLAARLAQAQSGQRIANNQPPEKLGLLVYTSLMGVTQSWLFAPTLFDLGRERDFFVRQINNLLEQP